MTTDTLTRAEAQAALMTDRTCRQAGVPMHPNEVNVPALVATCEALAEQLDALWRRSRKEHTSDCAPGDCLCWIEPAKRVINHWHKEK